MANVLILHGTIINETRDAANIIARVLMQKGHKVKVIDADHAEPEIILNYKVVIGGISMWSDCETPASFRRFIASMKDMNFENIRGAIFACKGRSTSDCVATIETVESIVEQNKGTLLKEMIIIETIKPDWQRKITQWAEDIAEKIDETE